MEPTFTNREIQFAEAVHNSLVRSYNIQGNPSAAIIKRYAQTLDLKSTTMNAIFTQYFPNTQQFDGNAIARFLRCVGNAQNGVAMDLLLQNSTEQVRSRPITEINQARQQKAVQLPLPADYFCDQSLQVVLQLTEQIQQTLSQLEEQDPTLPFLLSRETNQTIKKMLTDFTMQVKAEVDEIFQIQSTGTSDEAVKQLQQLVDEIQAASLKDLQDLQAAYQKTITAEAELAKCAKVIEMYSDEKRRIREIIQINEDTLERNQRLLGQHGEDLSHLTDTTLLQESLQLEQIHDPIIKGLQSPPDEKAKTPIRAIASGLPDFEPDLLKETKSVIHKKVDAISPEHPSPEERLPQRQSNDKLIDEKQDDDFWQMDPTQESADDLQ